MFGFYRMAAVSPRVTVADVAANLEAHLSAYRTASGDGAALVVFPELSLTGATCGDLFRQHVLLQKAWAAASEFAAASENAVAVFGLPLVFGNGLFDVAAVACRGRLIGLVPRCCSGGGFDSGRGINSAVDGVHFRSDLLFDGGFRFAVTVGMDRFLPDSGAAAVSGGALVIANPHAAPRVPGFDGDADAAALSGRLGAVYVTASAGWGESTTDAVFAGNSRIGSRGIPVSSAPAFARNGSTIYFDADLDAVRSRRISSPLFPVAPDAEALEISPLPGSPDIRFAHNPAAPFLPERRRDEFCGEVFDIQVSGLARRMEHTGAKCMVIGVSGGLDSTLALMVMARCRELLQLPDDSIRAFTLPGFGTSGRTHDNAVALCRALKVSLDEIDITAACRQHFADLGHDGRADTVFENAQARERTQILMDAANLYGGLLIGTGDLSELALGWCTYNGDQMSMYSVNGSVPKTLIPVLLEHESVRRGNPELSRVLRSIVDTPISPELLPLAGDGALEQKTEEVVGPYELHDFFLWQLLDSGAEPEKIAFMAEAAFAGRYSRAVIDKWLKVFGRRFIGQQFKRSAMPDGAAAGRFSLSPRGGWNMPSDASASLWKDW